MSESPEDQPSTGILGRIGYWLSPWRGRASVPPCENDSNDSSSGSYAEGTEGEDGEESVKGVPSGEEQDSSSEKFFPCEEENATQSARRDSSAERGGPREEELAVCREQRRGRGNEREERSNDQKRCGTLTSLAPHTQDRFSQTRDSMHT
ncbi:hypothetical protein OJAV_G00229240 [Oryzias javanicus]|uniref:Uncharacterized protein n=1 Tax=Oryzias javanicus TaxID=123683 RepID=A0A3S2P9I8_ORYJA|nr:hypothetical protein OJAV_G00229240 [Oryzias javanicus]